MKPRGACNLACVSLVIVIAAGVWTHPARSADSDSVLLFDGRSTNGWMTNTGKPVPAENVQADGLNPHNSGGYLIVHEKPWGNFVLDFEYKLSKGCNSGVFIRVGDLKNPVYTGIEVAIDDTTGAGVHDTGAFYDLVAPTANAQRPTGEWNRMRITVDGPKLTVAVNEKLVSRIDLEEWPQPGKRPDGSSHKFRNVAIKELPRVGSIGFQDHGQDCWFRNIRIKPLP